MYKSNKQQAKSDKEIKRNQLTKKPPTIIGNFHRNMLFTWYHFFTIELLIFRDYIECLICLFPLASLEPLLNTLKVTHCDELHHLTLFTRKTFDRFYW